MTARYAVPNPVAPWAEVMPHTPPMTTDDLHRIPDDGWAYELVQGVLVRMPMSSGEASSIGSRLLARLGVYVEDHALGRVTGEQGGYRLDPLRPRETEVAPDIGFVQAARVPSRASLITARPGRWRLTWPWRSPRRTSSPPAWRRRPPVSLLRDPPCLGDLAPLRARGCVASRR